MGAQIGDVEDTMTLSADVTPRFTVVTPTYNRGFIIERAIESVLAQTHPTWEMIIIDDGSTDDTRERVQPYLSDPRIRYHFESVNRGVLCARNRAWDRISAETDWVVHLDSDDVLMPDALATIREVIHEHPGFEWYHFAAVWDHGAVSSQVERDGFVGSYEGRLLRRDAQGEWVQVLHRNIIDEGYRFLETLRSNESTGLWYRLARSRPVYYCTKVVRIQNSQTVSDTRPGRRVASDYPPRVVRMRTFFHEFGPDLQRLDVAAYERSWAKYVKTVVKAGDRKEAFRLWREGVRRDPLRWVHWRTLFWLLGKAV